MHSLIHSYQTDIAYMLLLVCIDGIEVNEVTK